MSCVFESFPADCFTSCLARRLLGAAARHFLSPLPADVGASRYSTAESLHQDTGHTPVNRHANGGSGQKQSDERRRVQDLPALTLQRFSQEVHASCVYVCVCGGGGLNINPCIFTEVMMQLAYRPWCLLKSCLSRSSRALPPAGARVIRSHLESIYSCKLYQSAHS